MLPTSEIPSVPRGPGPVRAALLLAARRLWSERGPDVALRAVAAEAGVNHGLIHHYVGNKDDLLRAVLEEDNEHGVSIAVEMAEVGRGTRAMFLVGTDHPEHSRLSAWLTLTGRGDLLATQAPSMSDVIVEIAAASPQDDPARTRATLALTIAAVHGWALFSSQIGDLLGGDAEELRRQVGDLLGSLASPPATTQEQNG